MGLGLLSDHGLPLCCMQMFLAARALVGEAGAGGKVTVLLADQHAVSAGERPDDVRRRARVRAAEVEAIGRLLHLHCTVLLASGMDAIPEFHAQLRRVREWLPSLHAEGIPQLPEYSVRGVADVLFFNRSGGVKIGWSVDCILRTGRGRNHEPETDLIAARIDPSTAAVYVRHGVTLDSNRPRAVPYTEIADPASRLMLTGSERGSFAEKVNAPRVTPRRRAAVLEHLKLTVDSFECLVRPLAGADLLGKAESLQRELASLLAPVTVEAEPMAL